MYERGCKNGKRVQCNMGAKNHGVLLPDADRSKSLNQIVGAAFGAAGQRCMALSTLVLVAETKHWLGELKERAQKLKVGSGKSFAFALHLLHPILNRCLHIYMEYNFIV